MGGKIGKTLRTVKGERRGAEDIVKTPNQEEGLSSKR